jgi:hypothetical protein
MTDRKWPLAAIENAEIEPKKRPLCTGKRPLS